MGRRTPKELPPARGRHAGRIHPRRALPARGIRRDRPRADLRGT